LTNSNRFLNFVHC